MNSALRYTVMPFYQMLRRWYSVDYQFRLARRYSRSSIWTRRSYSIAFRRQDYAMILKACRVRKQDALRFLEEAAIERAQFILQRELNQRAELNSK